MKALTEPDYGSDASSLGTTATKVHLPFTPFYHSNSNVS